MICMLRGSLTNHRVLFGDSIGYERSLPQAVICSRPIRKSCSIA